MTQKSSEPATVECGRCGRARTVGLPCPHCNEPADRPDGFHFACANAGCDHIHQVPRSFVGELVEGYPWTCPACGVLQVARLGSLPESRLLTDPNAIQKLARVVEALEARAALPAPTRDDLPGCVCGAPPGLCCTKAACQSPARFITAEP